MYKNDVTDRMERYRRQRIKTKILSALALFILFATIIGSQCFRFDSAGGSHRIIPTAMDSDFWGNYKVYFKTSEFTHNAQEDYYFIEKGNTVIADKIDEAIIKGNEIVVYYDRYIGVKGFTAPKTSPIIRVEEIK